MKKKKRKNKKTKVDTSDYYTEVFSKGKKLEEISDKEELTTFKKFRESEYFAPSVFAVVVSIINFTIGIEYAFFFLLACVVVGGFMSLLVAVLVTFDLRVPGEKFILKRERRFMIFCTILVLIIFFGVLFISQIAPFN